MPAIKLHFKTNVSSEATFEGSVEPDGMTGYSFSGTLIASCPLDRENAGFDNVVRLGHGGSSAEYTYLDFTLSGKSDNTFKVNGKGKRAPNETVDFRLGFNEGYDGSFTYGNKITCALGVVADDAEPLDETMPEKEKLKGDLEMLKSGHFNKYDS